MSTLTDDLLNEDIREEYKKHKSIFRTAKTLGISLDRVKMIISMEEFHIERRSPQYNGEGRPELVKFRVATKHGNDQWDNRNPDIAQARANYEKGTHEMATGRDGDWSILYSIPRAVVQPRAGYFRLGAE